MQYEFKFNLTKIQLDKFLKKYMYGGLTYTIPETVLFLTRLIFLKAYIEIVTK